jgi:hypothetical protein
LLIPPIPWNFYKTNDHASKHLEITHSNGFQSLLFAHVLELQGPVNVIMGGMSQLHQAFPDALGAPLHLMPPGLIDMLHGHITQGDHYLADYSFIFCHIEFSIDARLNGFYVNRYQPDQFHNA